MKYRTISRVGIYMYASLVKVYKFRCCIALDKTVLLRKWNKRVSHKHHFNSLGYLHIRTTEVLINFVANKKIIKPVEVASLVEMSG